MITTRSLLLALLVLTLSLATAAAEPGVEAPDEWDPEQGTSYSSTHTAVATAPGIPSAFLLEIEAAQHLGVDGQFQQAGTDGLLSAGPVDVLAEITFRNDRKYAEQLSGFWLGFNATLDQGGVALDLAPFTLRAGRFHHRDFVSSPYSLFVSSRDLSAPLLDLSIATSKLFFTTRWLQLNEDSRLGYPDRGANIRSYGVQVGDLRVGYQDIAVYSGRTFDIEYLLNPIPTFFLQYARLSTGTPWAAGSNDNSILGFFADYTKPDLYGYGQVLIDDFNFNAIFFPDRTQNPFKVAWSTGGAVDLGPGRLGAYHAGATKYTFQPYGGGSVGSATDTRYGYTYYPEVEYTVEGEVRVIAPQENYIGYLHGENNLAFLVDYALPVDRFTTRGSLELTISGDKSPANPWHQYNTYLDDGEGTRFLESDRLETKLLAAGRASAPFGPWSVFADLSLGWVWNELELVQVPPELAGPNNTIRYFSPGTTSRPLATLTVGGSYSFEMPH